MSRLASLRGLAARLMTEGLTPTGAAAAVFTGVFIGIVPIYGVQSIVAIALAAYFRLNKPLTFGATFVNNPLLQPFIVAASIEVGHLALYGQWVLLDGFSIASPGHVGAWVVGSVVLALVAGGAGGAVAWSVVAWHSGRARRARLAGFRRYVAAHALNLSAQARRFIWWKIRLDRIFSVLIDEDLGTGPVVDLGCGYGEVLALAAFCDNRRVLYGCDVDGRRVAAARALLRDLDPHLDVADVGAFPIPPAGLIVLMDVLQYLQPAQQAALLARCSVALTPHGRLIVRVHDVGRGLRARLTTAFDSLVFRSAGFRSRPAHLTVSEYRRIMTDAGLVVTERPMKNMLPLVHVVMTGRKPGAAA